jgi:hypothetical protein
VLEIPFPPLANAIPRKKRRNSWEMEKSGNFEGKGRNSKKIGNHKAKRFF